MLAESTAQRLPIVIGVTGHRDVRPEHEAALAAALDEIIGQLQTEYPSTPLLLLTPLAEGADQLAAEVARRRSIPYRVPLPMPLESYRDDFPAGARRAYFDELLRGADGPPYAMPFFDTNDAENIADPIRRAEQYALLAAHLARAAHVLIAFWDGVATQTVGGTAQAVRFRVLGVPKRYHPASVIDAPETGPVHHIYTPRSGGGALARPAGTHTLRVAREPAGGASKPPESFAEVMAQIEELDACEPDPFATLYRRIDSFNEDCARVPGERSSNPTGAATATTTASLMHAAERVASHYQKKFVTALQRLFCASALALFVFELYAHVLPSAHPLVAAYLAASLFAIWTYTSARRGRWQDRAQDYRALELGLNVQQAWDAAGLGQSVADFYIRRQRTELDWIRDAIRTAHLVDRREPFDEAHGVATVRAFVERQFAYFAGTVASPGAAKRELDKAELYERLSGISLRTSFTVSALLVVYGLVAWLVPDALHGIPDEERWRGGLIFVIASTAIAAALFHDYPARRAHRQHARRYEVMGRICGRALDALDSAEDEAAWRDPGDEPRPSCIAIARACILELGHEALSENGDWLLLHRELPIELLAVG